MKKYVFLLMIPITMLSLAFLPLGKQKCFDPTVKESVAIGPLHWISKYELSQAEYKLFLADLKLQGKDALATSYFPDTSLWLRDFNDPYSKFYFQHEAFSDYPVLGISYEAAVAYCDWATDHLQKQREKCGCEDAHLRFRLPTEAEWLEAAGFNRPGSGLFPGGYNYPRDHKGDFSFNHKLGKGNFAGMAGGKGKDYEGYMITAPVKSFKPDQNGLYNMTGNIAEMVQEKGKAKGGSWWHESNDCRYESVLHYEGPETWLGFRLVIEQLQ
jgi:formylglycine-generating enzyme required for sulfatase activity